jgi:zinc transporter ZupT
LKPLHYRSLAVGALLSAALLDLLPEAFNSADRARELCWTFLGGLIFFFLLRKAELVDLPRDLRVLGTASHAFFRRLQRWISPALLVTAASVSAWLMSERPDQIPYVLVAASSGLVFVALSELAPLMRRPRSRKDAAVQAASLLVGVTLVTWVNRIS